MENLYVGVASLRLSFPDVRQVSTKVLKAFRILPQDVGPRNIAEGGDALGLRRWYERTLCRA
jgi:hypothetical protein